MINLRLVTQKYPECMQSKEKLSALLNDLFPDQRQMAYILSLSYDCGIVDELKRLERLDMIGQSKFVQRLMLRYGVQEQLAHEALNLWCDALEVKCDKCSEPQNTATHIKCNKLEVGAIVDAKVKAVLDSIYIMDVGIPGERAVLPKAYCNKDNVSVGDRITTIVKSFDKEGKYPCWYLSAKIPKTFNVGDRVVGTVSQITSFGAFVDLDGCQSGLIHISDLAWEKVKTVTDYVSCGDQIDVLITDISSNGRISLSRKFPESDPWNKIKSHPIDVAICGTITAVLQFGFFVDLGDGIEGLVHRSEYSQNDQFSKGQTVRVSIRDIDDEKRRVSLYLVH